MSGLCHRHPGSTDYLAAIVGFGAHHLRTAAIAARDGRSTSWTCMGSGACFQLDRRRKEVATRNQEGTKAAAAGAGASGCNHLGCEEGLS
mmetsp:Transcript_40169/g.52643  ORF Transcript_40169/g.52643 Transcript_40169/m.52643 type:complete len:90 (-) Transcript_40169:449-718(-)